MKSPLLLPLPGNETLTAAIAAAGAGDVGALDIHRFPDGESLVRLKTPVVQRDVCFVCSLDTPDTRILPLLFAADAARDLGAASVGVIAPYLAYLRQDRRFHDGEAISSRPFARLLSSAFDWLVTVDPHLHRYHSLDDVYAIPGIALHAGNVIATWLRTTVPDALLIGPDSESEQWVSDVAQGAGMPYAVCSKIRSGDTDVEITLPDMEQHRGRQPVLVDDIASSGRTLAAASQALMMKGFTKPDVVIVHPLFAGGSFDIVSQVAREVISTNTIAHPSNRINVAPLIADAIGGLRANRR